MTIDEKKQRYNELAHAMQTGVAFKMEVDPLETSPKHLRVGVNAAMSEHGALVELMFKKGVITEDEYLDSVIKYMEMEVLSYEAYLETGGNTKINLM